MKSNWKMIELTAKQKKGVRDVNKLMEVKNYKKGLKEIQKLLKELPDYPEFVTKQALFHFYLGDDTLALDVSKKAVFLSKMQSQECWQNYGFVMRQRKDYPGALSAYKQALKFSPQQPAILRQISNLQAQSRDFNGLYDIRLEILKQKPNAINNWLGISMASYMKGDYNATVELLKSTTNVMQGADIKPPQLNNFNIFCCIVHRQTGDNQQFYKQLKQREKLILDKIFYKQLLIQACLGLNKKQETQQLIDQLLQQYPENTDYFETLRQIRGVPLENDKLQVFYSEIAKKYKSRMANLLQISQIKTETLFKQKLQQFILPSYKKNIVSTFSEIRLLYQNPQAHKWIGDVFLSFETSLRAGNFPNGQALVSPTEFIWSLYLRSQHLALTFETLPEALKLIDEAINHTPTLVELYMVKAHILQRQHQHPDAVKIINEARQLDKADRYMNNICVKYMLRALKPQMAENIMKAFMGTESTAYDLQNMWFEIQMARCYLQKGQYGPGLRHLNFIQTQFQDMYEDQYDFHSYAMYKWCLKEYIDLIKLGDDIFNDRRYMQAAAIAIKYFMQYAVSKDQLPQPKQYSEYPAILDYSGIQYLKKMKNPLEQALKWARNVASAKFVNKNNDDLNNIFFKAFGQALNLFIHLNKPMLALKTLKKLLKTKTNPTVTHLFKLKAIIYFTKVVDSEVHATTKEIIKNQLAGLLDGAADAKSFNEKITKTWEKTSQTLLRQQQALIILDGGKRESFIALYQKLLNQSTSLQDALRLVHKLQFYRLVDQPLKDKLNEKYGSKTVYFQNWSKTLDDIKKEQLSDWWNLKWTDADSPNDEEKEKTETETK